MPPSRYRWAILPSCDAHTIYISNFVCLSHPLVHHTARKGPKALAFFKGSDNLNFQESKCKPRAQKTQKNTLNPFEKNSSIAMKNEKKRVAENLRKQACCSIEKVPYIVTVFPIYGHGNHCQNDQKEESRQRKMKANMQTIHGKDGRNIGMQCTYL